MGRTPDRFPGVREDEGVLLESGATTPTVSGEFRYVTGVGFRFYQEGVEIGLGVQPGDHPKLRQLIHFIDNGPAEGFTTGAFREVLPVADPFPTSVIWWTDSGKTEKIVEKTITYTGVNPTTIEWEIYDTDGSTVLATVTDTISYSGVFETSRTRAIA